MPPFLSALSLRVPFVFAAALCLGVTAACGLGGQAQEGSGDGATTQAIARGMPNLLTLMYHDVLDCSLGKPAGMVADDVCLADLEKQLDLLLARGYKTVDLAQVLSARERGARLPAKSLLLTFDDNYYGAVVHGLPLLAQRGMKATIFAHTALVRRATIPATLAEAQWRAAAHPKASWAEMVDAELSAGGRLFRYESHTVTHRNLTELSLEEVARELIDSKKAIEDAFRKELASRGLRYVDAVPTGRFVDTSGNKRVVALAYPFGAVNAAVHAAAQANGYRLAFEVGYAEAYGNESFAMPRMGVGLRLTLPLDFAGAIKYFEASRRR